MSFYIADDLFFDFYLNNAQVPITLENINSLVITSNIYDLLPSVRLDIKDNKNIFAKGLLTDGAILSVAVGNDSDTALKNITDFVLIGIPEEQRLTNGNSYTIYGTLNTPYLWKNMEPYGFTGTSSQVLQDLAKKAGLSYEGINTLDSMTWLSGTLSKADFAKKITNHGWSNDFSCMKSVITFDKKFLYKDINNLKASGYTLTNSKSDFNKQNKSQEIEFAEVTFSNKAGLYNYNYGYQTRFVEYGFQGTQEFSQIAYDKEDAAVLNINKVTYDAAGLIRNEIMPLNIGNIHQNYSRAYFQNMRCSAFNSLKAETYFYHKTPLEVLDRTSFSSLDPQTKEPDLAKAGKWTVEAKTIAISQQKYVEKLVLSSTGIELDLFNNLI